MRNVLKTPVPRVLAWDSSSLNAVKAEYIIMEKVNGVQLATEWLSMHFDQKVKLIKSIGCLQETWAGLPYSHIGSVYYAKDPSPDGRPIPVQFSDADEKVTGSCFATGPIVGRQWCDIGRASLDYDRAPCKDRQSSFSGTYAHIHPQGAPVRFTDRR